MLLFVQTEIERNRKMKSGNIFIDNDGADVRKIDINNRNQVLSDYMDMLNRANKNRDRFFRVNSKEWDDFYVYLHSPNNQYWENVDMNTKTYFQNEFCHPKIINSIADFDVLQGPKTYGGFEYKGHPLTDYIHNIVTWEDWHYKWNLEHPDEPEADALHNGIWICFERLLAILSYELKKVNIPVPLDPQRIVNDFHEQKMKHLDERERICESKRIGAKICEANLYQREVELEKLEADHGNKLAERIYSLKIGHKYQFLSIDKQHGMLELCDDKGDHQMEIRFDGTKNKDREVDHSLKCVKEWKKIYNK